MSLINSLNISLNVHTSVSYFQELYLHGNRISHLRQCEKFLPTSLETLTLAKNSITDLNELSFLCNLLQLNSITLHDNPCLQMTGGNSM